MTEQHVSISSSPLDVTLGAEQSSGESAVRPVDLPAGHVIGRHVVVERLGAGAMGVVYAAYDPELDRRIAIKVLREPAAAGSPRRARMLREAQALARLAHPNVVAIHDVGTLDERVWIAMEYVEGETLAAWRKRTNPTWREIVAVMAAAGRGLAAAHAVGLVHRDVKPDNVMVGTDGRVRVMDFGLAFAVASGDAIDPPSESSRASISSHAQTLAGALLGTPGYMSPEQLHHREVDAASDQFAFSVTLWEACYGTKAFAGDSVVEVSASVLQGRIASSPTDSHVPKWLRDVALRGMATNPKHRFAAMDELLDALERGQSLARRRIGYVAVAAIAIVGGLAFASHLTVRRAREAACVDEGAAIAQLWPGPNGARRAAMTDAMAATGVSFAADTAERASTGLDSYAAAWSAARTSACLRDESDALRDQVLACLDDRKDGLAATIDILLAADRNVAMAAVTATDDLPLIPACEDPEKLRLEQSNGDATWAEERALRKRMTVVLAAARVGRYEGIMDEAIALVEGAKASGDGPIIAQAHSLHAEALMRGSKFEEGAAAMRSSFTSALAAGRDDIAVDAAANLAFAVGYRLGRHDEAMHWIETADALLRRLPSDAKASQSLVRHNEAILFAISGDPTRGVASLETARDLMIEAKGEDSISVARIRSDLGAVHTAAGNQMRALEEHRRALEIYEATLGPDHPMLVTTHINIGSALDRLGENAKALVAFERALAIAELSDGPEHANVASTLEALGSTHFQLGDAERAVGELERALAIRKAVFPRDHPDVIKSLAQLAMVEVHLGRLHAADGHLEAALASPTAIHTPFESGWIGVLRGRIHLERGEPSEATAAIEAAIAAGAVDGPYLAYGKLTLAEALRRAGADMARARSLAREAKELLARPGIRHELFISLVDAWLAEHDQPPR